MRLVKTHAAQSPTHHAHRRKRAHWPSGDRRSRQAAAQGSPAGPQLPTRQPWTHRHALSPDAPRPTSPPRRERMQKVQLRYRPIDTLHAPSRDPRRGIAEQRRDATRRSSGSASQSRRHNIAEHARAKRATEYQQAQSIGRRHIRLRCESSDRRAYRIAGNHGCRCLGHALTSQRNSTRAARRDAPGSGWRGRAPRSAHAGSRSDDAA